MTKKVKPAKKAKKPADHQKNPYHNIYLVVQT